MIVCLAPACRDATKQIVYITQGEKKICRSVHPTLYCPGTCSSVEEEGIHEFTCIKIGEPGSKFDNASPVFLPYTAVVECHEEE